VYIQLVSFGIQELVLKQREIVVGQHFVEKSVFKAPFMKQTKPTLTQIGIHKGVYKQGKTFGFMLTFYHLDARFQEIDKQDRGPYLAFPVAYGAIFQRINLGSRTNPLAGYLHQTKFGKGQYLVFGRIAFHVLTHALVHLLLVFGRTHVY
jgi:hypothetical protein